MVHVPNSVNLRTVTTITYGETTRRRLTAKSQDDKNSLPSPLNFLSSAFHGSHELPYLFSNTLSSSLCSVYTCVSHTVRQDLPIVLTIFQGSLPP